MQKSRLWIRLFLATSITTSTCFITVACNEQKTLDLGAVNFVSINFAVNDKTDLTPDEINAAKNIIRQTTITTINQHIAHTSINQDYCIDNSSFGTRDTTNGLDVHIYGISETVIGDNFLHIDFQNPFDLATLQFGAINIPVLNNTYLTNEDIALVHQTIITMIEQNLSGHPFPLRLNVDYQIDLHAIAVGASLSHTTVEVSSLSKLVKNTVKLHVNFVNPLDLSTLKFPSLMFHVINCYRVTQSEIHNIRHKVTDTVTTIINHKTAGLQSEVDYQIDLNPLRENVNLSNGLDLVINSLSPRTIATNHIYLNFANLTTS